MYWVLTTIVVALFVYEFAALKRGKHETISEVVWRLTFRHPIIPLLFGILMGHFFWPSASCYDLWGK